MQASTCFRKSLYIDFLIYSIVICKSHLIKSKKIPQNIPIKKF